MIQYFTYSMTNTSGRRVLTYKKSDTSMKSHRQVDDCIVRSIGQAKFYFMYLCWHDQDQDQDHLQLPGLRALGWLED